MHLKLPFDQVVQKLNTFTQVTSALVVPYCEAILSNLHSSLISEKTQVGVYIFCNS